jgi:hypothetical protein
VFMLILPLRLEYLYPEKLVIVTYPSGVHESFNILLKPITLLVLSSSTRIVIFGFPPGRR